MRQHRNDDLLNIYKNYNFFKYKEYIINKILTIKYTIIYHSTQIKHENYVNCNLGKVKKRLFFVLIDIQHFILGFIQLFFFTLDPSNQQKKSRNVFFKRNTDSTGFLKIAMGYGPIWANSIQYGFGLP